MIEYDLVLMSLVIFVPAAFGLLCLLFPARWVEGVPEAVDTLRELLRHGDAVLVKGSRAMGMERVAEALSVVSAA